MICSRFAEASLTADDALVLGQAQQGVRGSMLKPVRPGTL